MSDTLNKPLHAAELWLSADVAKAKFDASWRLTTDGPATPQDLRRMKTRTFERTQKGASAFLEWGQSLLKEGQKLCVIMEATGYYSLELTAWLVAASSGLKVVVVKPVVVRDHGSSIGCRNKTDELDARVIASYGATYRPEPAPQLSGVFLALRSVCRLRQVLVEELTANTNRVESLESAHVPARVQKQLLKSQKAVIRALKKEIEALEKEIEKLIESDAEVGRQVKRITSIPGVGRMTAATVLGELGDLRDYESARQLTAHAGLNPRISKSGTKEKKARISKQGPPQVRRGLYLSAMACLRHNDRLKERKAHLVAQGKTSMTAHVANMRTLLVIMHALVTKDEDYDPTHHLTCGKAVEKAVENLGQQAAA